jgi:hypothetical protein
VAAAVETTARIERTWNMLMMMIVLWQNNEEENKS